MKHTKILVLLFMAVLLATGLFLVPQVSAEEESMMQSLQTVYEEELYAREMYRQMAENFVNDDFYNRLMSAEEKHALASKRVMEYKGIRLAEPKIELTVEKDELKALEFALKFEKDDVDSLAKRIEESSDQIETLLFTRLKDRSERHVEALERAITAYVEGDTDLNGICDGNCDPRFGGCQDGQCRGQNGICQGGQCQNNGQGQNCQGGQCQNNGQGQGQGLGQQGQGQGQGANGQQQQNQDCEGGSCTGWQNRGQGQVEIPTLQP